MQVGRISWRLQEDVCASSSHMAAVGLLMIKNVPRSTAWRAWGDKLRARAVPTCIGRRTGLGNHGAFHLPACGSIAAKNRLAEEYELRSSVPVVRGKIGVLRCKLRGERRLRTSRSRTVVGDKYEIGEELGSGADAVVYKGRNLETLEEVAIKVMDKEQMGLDGEERRQERLIREIFAMMSVRHPYITRLYDVSATKSNIFLVMEYLSGGDLYDRVQKMGRLQEMEARRHFQRLIDAVHFCHRRGVFHRDLKPDNLMLNAVDDLKVTDFGLSAIEMTSNWRLHSKVGTQGYQAPEVISPASYAGYSGAPADVWSCGVILFVLLAGYQPFHVEDDSVLQMFQRLMKSDYSCPTYFSDGAQKLIAQILIPDARSRITTEEIYDNDWFQTDYVPPEFHEIQRVDADRKAIEAVFMQARNDEASALRPASFSAFDLLGQAAPVDHALAPYFSRTGRDVGRKQETRFTSKLPAQEILQLIEAAAETLGFGAQIRGYQMKLDETMKHIDREPLSAVAEIFEVVPGLSVVVLRKFSGDPSDYQQFSTGLALRLKYRGITELFLNHK